MSIKEVEWDKIQWQALGNICGFYERQGILSIWAPTVYSRTTVLHTFMMLFCILLPILENGLLSVFLNAFLWLTFFICIHIKAHVWLWDYQILSRFTLLITVCMFSVVTILWHKWIVNSSIFLAAVGARWAWGVSQRAWQSKALANYLQSIRSDASSLPSCWVSFTCQEIRQQPTDRQ